ncbi:methyltransferase domain-containing protein [Roseospira marina]|uniref:Methyltransferase domain-containing protein n=1 Tax=Roseospira marina TaxID=140057 RepID=A0A5M6ICP6_9PROT|nr:methyltransferase [Roseospira marina]KAA5605539.1 methyltransferase domain-containing protein [Roseospira marina]MBB4313401.1 demethylspheroidene O-methyltransferase [Roseospira marina]MBB5085858.1 demethylspheroidene O-methyltransferase [Roseospira marina]
MRDRLLAARDWFWLRPWFPRRVGRLPVIRILARRTARQLFDLCAGFVYSQVLLAAVRLRLCETLADGPLATAPLAERLGLTEDATRRLLDATDALGLTMPRSRGRHGLDELGMALLGSPAVASLIEHHALLYADLRDPVALLKGEAGETEMARYWAYACAATPAEADDAQVAGYSALMAATQGLIADEILTAYPPKGAARWLDVGGGEGAFATAVARRARRARVTVFDLPAVAARARVRLAAEGLADRVTAVGGDFCRDPLPEGADVISLVRVLHDHDDDVVRALLRAARRAIAPNGRLVVAEPMAGTRGAEPIGGAYFGFYLLAMGSGRARTVERLTALLEEAGFGAIETPRTHQPLLTRLMVARPIGFPKDAPDVVADTT